MCVVFMFLLERNFESRLVLYTEAQLDISGNQSEKFNINKFS